MPGLAQPGVLDPTFGQGGVFLSEQGGRAALASLLLSDGRLLLAGVEDGDAAVFRLLPEGALDPSFGIGGIARVDFGGIDDFASAVALEPDGDILITGARLSKSGGFPRDAALARLSADGILDTDFGTAGVAVLSGFVNSSFSSIRGFSDGHIVVTGAATSFAPQSGPVMARYTPDGVLDNAFGDGGVAFSAFNDSFSSSGGIIEGDGSALVAGSIARGNPFEADPAVVRLLPTGALDAGFGSNGLATVMTGQLFSIAAGVTRDGAGRIVGGGTALNSTSGFREAFALRLLPDGTPDAAFGTNGVATTLGGTPLADGGPAVAQADGKVLIVGSTGTSALRDPAVFRFTEGGEPDATFGSGGSATVSLERTARANTLVLQHGGEIVWAGTLFDGTTGQSQGAVVARLVNDGEPVGVEGMPDVAGLLRLRLDGPNPFHSTTALLITSERPSQVRIVAFDVLGREVAVLFEGSVSEAGVRVPFAGTRLAPGIYFVRAEGGSAAAALSLVRL